MNRLYLMSAQLSIFIPAEIQSATTILVLKMIAFLQSVKLALIFMTPLTNTADATSQINVGEEQIAKLLTAYKEDICPKKDCYKRKVYSQRKKGKKTTGFSNFSKFCNN